MTNAKLSTEEKYKKPDATMLNIPMLKITQIGSSIACKQVQKDTLKGLGLNKLHKVVMRSGDSATLGMLNRVKHLVKIESMQ